ncbi:tachylectin-related carbohydrate-binding protein [Umezawaea sp. Da 62-37]|uniref:tachylectin-related carbohydrate-binding protein n=1 Tax=Umezawaea sp. Da 62-37 TaxID=3075927 RepID=UPI0028F6FD3E|nr:tachylectin-related carbohydrate-binding protein [Umezawaea sp. Da 62-37]WNV89008.1 tachylectin-related carbohydrate-binding protein [Umezawaea sp. Da 62-37]
MTLVAPILLTSPQIASADTTLVCRSGVSVYTTRPNGDFYIHQHEEPETGLISWTGGAQQGTDWHGKTFAGPDGIIYNITDTGALNRFRWAPGWENGGAVQQIGSDWGVFTTAEYRNRITVDETGRIYAVNEAGQLKSYLWMGTEWANPDGDVVDTGWGQYDLIVAAGNGVIFARKPNGDLFRYRYHTESQRWIQYNLSVDSGWDIFSKVFSPGGDLLYGIRADGDGSDGDLLWYRYLEDTNTWVDSGVGKFIGSGWQNDEDTVAISDGCKLSATPFPQRVTAAPRPLAPTRAVLGRNSVPHYFYTNNLGQQIHLSQPDPTNPQTIDYWTPLGSELTNTPSVVTGQTGRLLSFALGQDGDTRSTLEPETGFIGLEPVSIGGWTSGPADFARNSSGIIRGFAVDANGKLWTRTQSAVDGPFAGWRDLGTISGGLSDFVVIPSGTAFEIVGRAVNGNVKAARFTTTLAAWRNVAGGAIAGRPAALVNPDGRLQVYATRTDGTVATQRETATGFPGTWQTITGLTANGAPAAVTGGSGVVKVAVRGNDNYIYTTEQTAPGGTAYRAWTALADNQTQTRYPSDTDPAAVKATSGAVLITFRNSDETSFFYQSVSAQATTSKTTTEQTTYAGGPATKK